MAILNNEALRPVSPLDRVFSWHQHAALWFSLGVGLLVMQIGAYLVPAVGTKDAFFAIVLGSIIGASLLAWTAKVGCETGLTSSGLIHATYGSSFAKLPVVLNIIQLIGWTTFELVIMRDGTTAIGNQSFGLTLTGSIGIFATTLLWGGVLTVLIMGSMLTLVRQVISRIGLPLVIASLAWLTWQFGAQVQAKGLDTFIGRTGDGSMSMFSAMDLVIAMPVSWLPLIADYARHGKSGKGAMSGTWIGYVIANIWCYALGVMVVSVAQPSTDLVSAILLAQGGLLALSLILIDEIDNAYGDVYSSSVSTHSLLPKLSIRKWGVFIALLCTALALVLPIHSLEPFLLILSSVFVPLYGVILGRLGCQKNIEISDLQSINKVNLTAAVLWVGGIVVYHALAKWAPQWGSAMPTLAITFTLAWITRSKSVFQPRY